MLEPAAFTFLLSMKGLCDDSLPARHGKDVILAWFLVAFHILIQRTAGESVFF